MDISSINNEISLNNTLSPQQLGGSVRTESVEKNEESLYLSINDYNKRRDELSASLQSYNEGIGISITAQNGLEKEKSYLEKIDNKLTNIEDYQDKNQIKNELNQELFSFREAAYNTTYKNENLLYVDQYDESTSIDISTKEKNFSLEKPNTPEIASSISNEITKNDFNNPTSLVNTIETVKEGIKQIEQLQTQFQELRVNLQDSAKESISEQKQLMTQNTAAKQYDFPREVTDFTKSNINANAGYLAASQANIVQEQTVRLVGVR